MVQVITTSRPEWIAPFTGREPAQLRKPIRLVAKRGGNEIADGRPGRQWALPLADRVLLVATYWRTNLTMRQIGPLFGHRTPPRTGGSDTIDSLLAPGPGPHTPDRCGRGRRRHSGPDPRSPADHPVEELPLPHHRAGRHRRHAETRFMIATGNPQPGSRNDCTAYHDRRRLGTDQEHHRRLGSWRARDVAADHPARRHRRRRAAAAAHLPPPGRAEGYNPNAVRVLRIHDRADTPQREQHAERSSGTSSSTTRSSTPSGPRAARCRPAGGP
ncbi:transposase family protein [Amycolatopsis sp. FDAARGOS 1241]|nr:transposase family protein [Amycolatopsis sp. FDAARGOS 1241]